MNHEMKLAIIGSRTVSLSEIKIRRGISDEVFHLIDTIISGGARGIDTSAEKFANFYKFKFIKILPDWDTHGKSAGFLRNIKIVKEADLVLAFWDGESKGTLDTIKKAKKVNKLLAIFIVGKENDYDFLVENHRKAIE